MRRKGGLRSMVWGTEGRMEAVPTMCAPLTREFEVYVCLLSGNGTASRCDLLLNTDDPSTAPAQG